MKFKIKVVGIFVFILSTNLNLLMSAPESELLKNSVFTKTPEEVLGLNHKIERKNLNSKLFYLENNLLEVFPKFIDTPIALFECIAKKFITVNLPLIIDEIQYQGFDIEMNEKILFGIKTHYDIEKDTMMRCLWIEVYSGGETKPGFEKIFVLENRNTNFEAYESYNAQETLNLIQTFFNEIFIERVRECIRFN